MRVLSMSICKKAVCNYVLCKSYEKHMVIESYHGDETKDIPSALLFLRHSFKDASSTHENFSPRPRSHGSHYDVIMMSYKP